MVHRRELDGEEFVFGNQGDLWLNAMTWFDHGTGSVWSQPTAEAIMGPRKGDRLELLPSTLTTWADWRSDFPETVALDTHTRDNEFTLDRQAVVVTVGDDSLAVTIPDLREAGVVNATVGGSPVAFVLPSGTGRPTVWSREHAGTVLEFELEDDAIVDTATGLRFDARRGLGADGARLEPVPSFGSFPADYARIWPDGRVWRPTGPIPAARFSDSAP